MNHELKLLSFQNHKAKLRIDIFIVRKLTSNFSGYFEHEIENSKLYIVHNKKSYIILNLIINNKKT